MSAVPAGWYPDPDQSARRRYWDGAQWTDHFEASPVLAAGWYPDPQVDRQQRYWDGAGWSDHVQLVPIFDHMVPLPSFVRHKEQRLLITSEELVWGDEHILWDDVTWFTQVITIENGAEAQFEIQLVHGEMQTGLLFGRSSMRDRTARHAYDAVIGQLRRTLGTRVVNGLLDMVERGEPVRTAGLLLAPQGFGEEAKGELVPWPEFAGIEVNSYEGIYVRLFRTKGDKRKQAVRIKVTQLHSWAIPPVVEAFARRYGPQRPAT